MRERPFLHPNDYIDLLLKSYYSVLNDDDGFRRDLKALFRYAKNSGEFVDPPMTKSERDYEDEMEGLGFPPSDPDRKPPSPSVEEKFVRFSLKWKLPERSCYRSSDEGLPDLWCSYFVWKSKPGETPRLSVHSSQMMLSESPDTTINYDPTVDSLKSLREKIENAQKKAKRLGFIQLPPHHSNPADRKRFALRLYRRVVLGMKWAEIIRAEKAEQVADWPDSRTVRSTVKDWAKLLGIALPKTPPGRPRRSSSDTQK